MALQNAAVSDGASNTIRGAGFGGLSVTNVGTTATAFDVSAWQGQLIEIVTHNGFGWYLFAESAAATIDPAITGVTSAASANAGVPGLIGTSVPKQVSVPISSNTSTGSTVTGKVFLLIRSHTGTVDCKVHRA